MNGNGEQRVASLFPTTNPETEPRCLGCDGGSVHHTCGQEPDASEPAVPEPTEYTKMQMARVSMLLRKRMGEEGNATVTAPFETYVRPREMSYVDWQAGIRALQGVGALTIEEGRGHHGAKLYTLDAEPIAPPELTAWQKKDAKAVQNMGLLHDVIEQMAMGHTFTAGELAKKLGLRANSVGKQLNRIAMVKRIGNKSPYRYKRVDPKRARAPKPRPAPKPKPMSSLFKVVQARLPTFAYAELVKRAGENGVTAEEYAQLVLLNSLMGR